MSVLDLQRSARDHEGRIGAIERQMAADDGRLARVEAKVDRILGYGWRVVLVGIGALLSPWIASAVAPLIAAWVRR